MPRKMTILDWVFELERQAALSQKTLAQFVAECQNVKPVDNLPPEAAEEAIHEVKKFGENVHGNLVDILAEIGASDAKEI